MYKFIQSLIFFCIFSLFVTHNLLAKEKTKDDYLKDLNSDSIPLQIKACQYFAKEKDEATIEPLIFLLEDPNVDSHVKVALVNVLASIGDKNGIADTFIQVIHENRDPMLRYATFLSLLSLKNESKEEEMKEILLEFSNSSDLLLKDLAQKLRALLKNQ